MLYYVITNFYFANVTLANIATRRRRWDCDHDDDGDAMKLGDIGGY